MQSLSDDKECGIFIGNNQNIITWKNSVNQPIRFAGSTWFLFTLGRTILMSKTATNGIQVLRNINKRHIELLTSQVQCIQLIALQKAYCDLKILKSGGSLTDNLYFDGCKCWL